MKRDVEAERHDAARFAERERKAKEIERRLKAIELADSALQAGRLRAYYTFHHEKLHPYDVVKFEDNGKYWRVLLTKGFFVNLPKAEIVRVEPVECPTGYRTWIDQTGRYSTVAKYVQYKEPFVQLATPANRKVTVNEGKLSGVDRERLQEVIECRGSSVPQRRFFKSNRVSQVAMVTEVCLTSTATHWKATAEVHRTTKGNRVLEDNQFRYPVYAVISDESVPISQSREEAEQILFAASFPSDDWTEIDAAEHARLKRQFEE